jgi:hypothetical protein
VTGGARLLRRPACSTAAGPCSPPPYHRCSHEHHPCWERVGRARRQAWHTHRPSSLATSRVSQRACPSSDPTCCLAPVAASMSGLPTCIHEHHRVWVQVGRARRQPQHTHRPSSLATSYRGKGRAPPVDFGGAALEASCSLDARGWRLPAAPRSTAQTCDRLGEHTGQAGVGLRGKSCQHVVS